MCMPNGNYQVTVLPTTPTPSRVGHRVCPPSDRIAGALWESGNYSQGLADKNDLREWLWYQFERPSQGGICSLDPLKKSSFSLVPHNQNLDSSMIPIPQNGLCFPVPFSFRLLFPCSPKPLGVPHLKRTDRSTRLLQCVAVRYMIHFYCLAVEAGFYSDLVECWTLNPVDRVRSPVGENVIWIFFSFPITFGGQCGGGSLGAWWAKQVLGYHSELARHLYWHECIQMSRYRKEGCSS